MKTYTVQQAADILQVKPDTVLTYIQNAELKASKLENSYRITENNLQQFLKILEIKGGNKLYSEEELEDGFEAYKLGWINYFCECGLLKDDTVEELKEYNEYTPDFVCDEIADHLSDLYPDDFKLTRRIKECSTFSELARTLISTLKKKENRKSSF